MAIDPFQTRDWDDAGLATLDRPGLGPMLEFKPRDSVCALAELLDRGSSFDFTFLGGGHHFENAFCDLYLALRLVRAGGLIAMDDRWMPAVRAACAYFASKWGAAIEPMHPTRPLNRFVLITPPGRVADRRWDHFVEFDARDIEFECRV